MRKEPGEHCLSTLEACGEALKILEGSENGPRLQDNLNTILSKHVELHLKNAKEASQLRHSRDTISGDSKLKRPPTTIENTPTRLLVVDSNTSVTIRRLTHEDIPVIDAWWDYGGTPKSAMTIARSLDADDHLKIGASLGIVDSDTLLACIVRYESGPLGIFHVSKEHRGKGYGTALLREAARLVSEARVQNDGILPLSAFIKDGNAASESTFARVGFIRENPNAKKGSGKRRANRKWIYSPSLQTQDDGAADPTQ